MTRATASRGGVRADPRLPSLCVINYNGASHLRTVLPPLRERVDAFGDVVLVDDASDDDSVATAERMWPGLRILRHERNRGPGAARNTGAAALGGRRILFLDNDVAPDPGCLDRLTSALDQDAGAVLAMPRVVYASEPGRIQFEGAEAHTSGTQMLCEAERPVAEAGVGPARRVTSMISACFLLDRDRWGDAPLFDERLHVFFEDHELGLRASLRGLGLLAVPAATCRHGDGTPGLSVRRTGRATPRRVHGTVLNRWQILLKLYQGRTLALLAPSLLLFELFQFIGGIAVGWLPPWLRALADLGRLAPDLLRRRRAFRRFRVVPDRAVLRPGPHPFSASLARRLPVRALRPVLDAAAAANWAVARPFLKR